MGRGLDLGLVALLLSAGACEKPQRLMRVGLDCPVPRDGGVGAQLRFGVWFEARPDAWQAKSDRPMAISLEGKRVGEVRSDCLAPALPASELRYVALGGAELFAAPRAASPFGRLVELTPVRLLVPAGDFALVGDEQRSLGLVRSTRLWTEPRTADEVALELHWLVEAGKRWHVAEALAELGATNLAQGALHDLACRVVFAGLADPAWAERLPVADCVEQPSVPSVARCALAIGQCPRGEDEVPQTVVRGQSPSATAWACVGPSGSAGLYVADRQGHAAHLGDVVVTSPGVCPESRPLAVRPVGLGACLEVVTEDEACATATGERLERAFCLPPPGSSPATAVEVHLAFRRLERHGLVDEECGELRDPIQNDAWLDDSLCAIERERLGPRATSHVVRDEYGYLLCVRGAHDERGTRDLAFRFDPGVIVELRGWPRVCDVDDP